MAAGYSAVSVAGFGQLISGHTPELRRPGSRWAAPSYDCR